MAAAKFLCYNRTLRPRNRSFANGTIVAPPAGDQPAPVAVVYPEGIWYAPKAAGDMDDIAVSHLGEGKPAESLIITPGSNPPQLPQRHCTGKGWLTPEHAAHMAFIKTGDDAGFEST
jgi:(2Fe-2S) ferredoxin